MEEKFCKFCGEKIPADAIICTKCGRQVEQLDNKSESAPIIINNSASASAAAAATVSQRPSGRERNKWVALILCLFLGLVGGHKFYEGKIGMGILYLFTFGLCFIGVIIDFIVILCKPNPYYVR